MPRDLKKWLYAIIALFLVSCSPQVSTQTQPSWIQISPEKSPPPSGQGAVAFVDSSNTAILFGGITLDKWLNETWIWNGKTWYQASTKHTPPARAKLAIEYDKVRDRVVLFGGEMDKTLFNDTWEWDGKDWQLMSPAHSPPARCCQAMAYDVVNKNIIMYGGYDPNRNIFLSDMWTWDGKDWTEIHSDMPEMSGHAMISFSTKSTIISVQTAGYGTWSWDGETWEKIEGKNPPNRSEGKIAFDKTHNWIAFFGGISNAQIRNDTWVFDGQSWAELSLSNSPPARFGHVLFYDPQRESIIVFGGIGNNNTRFGDMWELELPDISFESLPTNMIYNGNWKGKTSQGLETTFTVEHGEITAMKFQVERKGQNCSQTSEIKMESTLSPTAEATGNFTPIHPIENGSFTISDGNSGTNGTAYTLFGEFLSPQKASGTLEYKVLSGSCQGTEKFDWNATRLFP